MTVFFQMVLLIGLIVLILATGLAWSHRKAEVSPVEFFIKGTFIFWNLEKYVSRQYVKKTKSLWNIGGGIVILALLGLVLSGG